MSGGKKHREHGTQAKLAMDEAETIGQGTGARGLPTLPACTSIARHGSARGRRKKDQRWRTLDPQL